MKTREFDCALRENAERCALRGRIQRLLDKWQPKLGVSFQDWGLRKMKTYWGSTNRAERQVWFNEDLAKLPPRYIEYVVVHELAHLLTDGHDAHFYELMDRNLPGWRQMQSRIEAPLKRYS